MKAVTSLSGSLTVSEVADPRPAAGQLLLAVMRSDTEQTLAEAAL